MIGIGASPGIAFGKVLVLKNITLTVEKREIESSEAEISKFLQAIEASKEELMKIRDKALAELGKEEADIFEAHLIILEDAELITETIAQVESDNVNIEFAFKQIIEHYIEILESMDDSYMKERAADIKDVSARVLRNMMGMRTTDLSVLDAEVILIADDLTPSDTAIMDKSKVLGFLTNIGGRTSHTAIMARTLEIPAVVGLRNATEQLSDGDFVIINGDFGEVLINPTEKEIAQYSELKRIYEASKKEFAALINQPSITLDGKKVELAGNIGTPKDIAGLIKNDAEGVGLYRTEFLYMDRASLPTEEEQFHSYKEVLEALRPKPVIIRTLDIGGDKKLSYLNIGEEMNPFLGYRAIRICLEQKELFKTQLRALLRASSYGNLKIMFPMISSLEELLEAKAILNEVKESLQLAGIFYAPNIEIGIMIEVPSAAMISDILAKHVDFFSIGTNDLIQYTCAVDRMNEKIAHLYNPMNPAVLRLINKVIENGHNEKIWVGMCGEMAGDKRMIPILLGMGLDEFSMSPVAILPARKIIRSLKQYDMQEFTKAILNMGTAKEIEAYIEAKFSGK